MTENPRLWSIESREMSKRAKVVADASNYRHQRQRNPNALDPRPLDTNDLTSILTSTKNIIVTRLLERITLQMMVTVKRLPPTILGAHQMRPRRLIGVRQNLFLWLVT
jgi:hypothetical protein